MNQAQISEPQSSSLKFFNHYLSPNQRRSGGPFSIPKPNSNAILPLTFPTGDLSQQINNDLGQTRDHLAGLEGLIQSWQIRCMGRLPYNAGANEKQVKEQYMARKAEMQWLYGAIQDARQKLEAKLWEWKQAHDAVQQNLEGLEKILGTIDGFPGVLDAEMTG